MSAQGKTRQASRLGQGQRLKCALLVGVFFAGLLVTRPHLCAAQAGTHWSFTFGSGAAPAGAVRISSDTTYSSARGYGIDASLAPQTQFSQSAHALCSDRPFFFSATAPEGNYDVAITVGGGAAASTTTVKVESRRLLIDEVSTAPREFATRRFAVNVRSPEIATGRTVQLKGAENTSLDWDDKLTFELNGEHPCVSAVDVARNETAVTVYLAGDSTVVDQMKEPWAAWGQMLPAFFGPGVAIANHAESGESLKSFIRERRLDKILSTIRAGDYLFIQFAHNDQKQAPRYASTYVEAESTYKAYLNVFIEEARLRGATPVLVTSMNRRSFRPDGHIQNTLEGYPDAMRELAQAGAVPLIDLNAMSKTLYEALGPEGTLKAFVHFPANTFSGQPEELKDDTHFTNYGAYELAQCVVEGIEQVHLPLTKFLSKHPDFDPAHPDPVTDFKLPASPYSETVSATGKTQ